MSLTVEYRRPAIRHIHAPGAVTHAVVAGETAAVCGARPRAGIGRWGPPEAGPPACLACRRKLGMGPLPAPRPEGGAR